MSKNKFKNNKKPISNNTDKEHTLRPIMKNVLLSPEIFDYKNLDESDIRDRFRTMDDICENEIDGYIKFIRHNDLLSKYKENYYKSLQEENFIQAINKRNIYHKRILGLIEKLYNLPVDDKIANAKGYCKLCRGINKHFLLGICTRKHNYEETNNNYLDCKECIFKERCLDLDSDIDEIKTGLKPEQSLNYYYKESDKDLVAKEIFQPLAVNFNKIIIYDKLIGSKIDTNGIPRNFKRNLDYWLKKIYEFKPDIKVEIWTEYAEKFQDRKVTENSFIDYIKDFKQKSGNCMLFIKLFNSGKLEHDRFIITDKNHCYLMGSGIDSINYENNMQNWNITKQGWNKGERLLFQEGDGKHLALPI